MGRKRNIMSPLLEITSGHDKFLGPRRGVISLHGNLHVLGGEKVKSKYRGTSINFKEKYSLIFNLKSIVEN